MDPAGFDNRDDALAPSVEEPWRVRYDDFEDFYRGAYATVYRVASLVLRDTMLAEEVTHEVFLELLRGRGRYDPGRGTLRGWLRSVARHRAVDRVRAVQAARANDHRFACLDSDRINEGVEELVDRRAEYHEIRQALSGLPAHYREVIRLIYWNGYSQRELAEFYEIPLGTAKTRVRQALKAIRERLTEPG